MRKILLITSVLPWPLRFNGGAQRTALLRDALARHGRVDLLMIAGSTLHQESLDIQKLADEHNIVGYVIKQDTPVTKPWYLPGPLGSISGTVRQYAASYEPDPQAAQRLSKLMQSTKYDLIVSRYLQPALQCDVLRYKHVPSILDFDDIDWLTLETKLAAKPWGGLTGKMASRRVLDHVTRVSKNALNRFSDVFVTSEEDALALPRDADVLPNIPFSDKKDGWLEPIPPENDSKELLFVGDLQFPPNREGLDRFFANVWPVVCKAEPRARLSIVGRGLSDANKAKWGAIQNVDVIGFAPDLQDCYRRCAMTVVPIYFGGGTKIKVLESLAYGRTLVTTPEALRGYAALADASLVAAPTDAAFSAGIIDLLANPAKRNAMADRGRAVVFEEFSPNRFNAVVDKTLVKVFG